MDLLQSSQLFQYIQSFLKTKEYIRLMNTSQAMFHDIKRETTIYKLISTPHRPLDLGTFWKVVKEVKDGRKQVILNMKNVKPADLSILAFISQHLWKASIATDSSLFPSDFDFSIFNNIPIVHLEGFHGVTTITNGLQNIQELQLALSDLESISNIGDHGDSGSLRKLVIFWNKVKEFPEQMSENYFLSNLCAKHRVVNSSIIFSSLNSDPINMHHLFTRHLEYVNLDVNKMNLSVDQLSLLQNVKQLDLVNGNPSDEDEENDNYSELPIFPSFYGLSLSLTGFNVSIWERSCDMPNILSLTLKKCTSPATLPFLPKIVHVIVDKVKSLKTIQTFPTILKIELENMVNMTIERQPNLKWFRVTKCSEIVYLDTVPPPYLITFSMSESSNIDVSPFLKAKYFEINDSNPLIYSNVGEISDIRPGKHWSIIGEEKLEDMKKLHDLQILELESLKETDFNQLEITNIVRLSIFNCQDLTNTKNISNISKRLLINRCWNLVSLDSIQHTREVALGSLPKLTNISGLGHHEILHIFRVPYLAKIARWYSEDVKAGIASKNPFHDIFSTIKKCYIVKDTEDEDEIYYDEEESDNFNWISLYEAHSFYLLWHFT